jgi:hypothetical protein
LFTYSLSDTGNPNTIFDPKPLDNFLTEKWLIAPHVDLRIGDWWEHKFIFSYDHERQLNDPNQDGFVGPTRALFERTQVDYQNDLRPTSWLTVTSGFFYSSVNAGQEAAICPPDLWSAADVHKRSHRRNGWLLQH